MPDAIAAAFVESHPVEAARVLEDAVPDVAGEFLSTLSAPVASTMLREMFPSAAAAGLACLPPGGAAEIVRHLPTAFAAPLLLHLDSNQRGALMKALPAKVSVPLRMLLRFPSGSVGTILDPRAVTVRPETSVREATEMARRVPAPLYRHLYVLDEHRRLTGMIDSHQCLLLDPSLPVGKLDRDEPVALRARMSLLEANRHSGWEHNSVLPATDHRGVFLGVVHRTSLRQALAGGPDPDAEATLTGLVLDLIDLYWQTAAGLMTGAATPDDRDRKAS